MTTGLPGNGWPLSLRGKPLATIDDLRSRILNELKRPGLTSEADLAIADAVAFYSTYRFWFSEETHTFTTVADTASYSLPSDFRDWVKLEIIVGSQRWDLGCPWTYQEYRDAALDTVLERGQPTNWAIWESSLYLYPAPDGVYSLPMAYIEAIGVPAAGEENAWTTHAEPLIRTHAKIDLLTNVIRDMSGEAERLEPQRLRWLGHLQRRTQAMGRPNRVTPSSW